MGKGRKSGEKDKALKSIILITAVLTLIDKLMDIIQKLTD